MSTVTLCGVQRKDHLLCMPTNPKGTVRQWDNEVETLTYHWGKQITMHPSKVTLLHGQAREWLSERHNHSSWAPPTPRCSVLPRRTCPSGITAVMSWKASVHKLHVRAMQLRTWGFRLHSEWTLLLLSCTKVWHQSLMLTTRKHFQWQLFLRPKHKMITELMHKQSLLFILLILLLLHC